MVGPDCRSGDAGWWAGPSEFPVGVGPTSARGCKMDSARPNYYHGLHWIGWAIQQLGLACPWRLLFFFFWMSSWQYWVRSSILQVTFSLCLVCSNFALNLNLVRTNAATVFYLVAHECLLFSESPKPPFSELLTDWIWTHLQPYKTSKLCYWSQANKRAFRFLFS